MLAVHFHFLSAVVFLLHCQLSDIYLLIVILFYMGTEMWVRCAIAGCVMRNLLHLHCFCCALALPLTRVIAVYVMLFMLVCLPPSLAGSEAAAILLINLFVRNTKCKMALQNNAERLDFVVLPFCS
jgi:hypothetical protein